MTLSEPLLDQARALAQRDRTRPRQVNLRRAVSNAYYSLFHQFIGDCCMHVVGAGPTVRAHRTMLYRTLQHRDMRLAAETFPRAQWHPAILAAAGVTVPDSGLQTLARLFVRLQNARHAADYDPSATLANTRSSACCLGWKQPSRSLTESAATKRIASS